MRIFAAILILVTLTLSCNRNVYNTYDTISGRKMEKINLDILMALKSNISSTTITTVKNVNDKINIEIIDTVALTRTVIHNMATKDLVRAHVEFGIYKDIEGAIIESISYNSEGYPVKTSKFFCKTFSKTIEELRNAGLQGIPIELGYDFDKDGEIINVIDYDEGFIYSLKEVFDLLSHRDLDINNNRVVIEKDINNFQWRINYINMENNIAMRFILTIDAKSGEIISENKFVIK